jgi:purine-binding chemotaxis protein CheW
VFDLSARLGWGLTDPTARHVIIVVQLGNQLQGLIVDAVNDIVTLTEDTLQPPPNVGDDEANAFLDGLASVDDRMVMVLSLSKLTQATDIGESLAA